MDSASYGGSGHAAYQVRLRVEQSADETHSAAVDTPGPDSSNGVEPTNNVGGTDAAQCRPVAQDQLREPHPYRRNRDGTLTHCRAELQTAAASRFGLLHRRSPLPPPSGCRSFSAPAESAVTA